MDGPGASLTALGVAEVLDHLVRIMGADEENAALDVAQLGLIDGFAVDSTSATPKASPQRSYPTPATPDGSRRRPECYFGCPRCGPTCYLLAPRTRRWT